MRTNAANTDALFSFEVRGRFLAAVHVELAIGRHFGETTAPIGHKLKNDMSQFESWAITELVNPDQTALQIPLNSVR